MELYLGLALMALGVVLFLVGRTRSKTVRVEATTVSVAIGGNNHGSITNTNIGTTMPAVGRSHHRLTVVSIFVELAGIAVVIWHAWHLAAK